MSLSERRAIHALAARYSNTHAVEYNDSVHVRQGRRVIVVVDFDNDTVRVNRLYSAIDAKRANQVLEILGTVSRIVTLKYNHPEAAEHPPQYVTGPVYVWAATADSRSDEVIVRRFTPRETVALTELGGTT